mgnify:CR=1 FL=1
MNDGLIPNRYAKALYKFAIEEKASEEVYLQMKRLSESYEALPELKKTVDNPFLPVADREKVLLSASGAEKDGCLDKFILMVIKNNRESSMREMALSYGKIYREANNIAQVNIGTGEPQQIVCGAANCRAGLKTIVATLGTKLYDGDKEFAIKKSNACLPVSKLIKARSPWYLPCEAKQ